MLDLQDITIQYLSQKFQPELLTVVLDACIVLQRFNISNYENDLVTLLVQSHDLDSSDLRDRFTSRIYYEMIELLKSHVIEVDEDAEATLREITEVGKFLLLVQNLENTELLAYRAHGLGGAKSIFIDMMVMYGGLDAPRLMEMIASVGDKLIIAIREMAKDATEETTVTAEHRDLWRQFYIFTQGAECLGSRLYKEGFFGLPLEQTVGLASFNVQEALQETARVNVAQAALDALSLLLICSDTYQTVRVSLDSNSSVLIEESEILSQVRRAFTSIHSDFSNWVEAHDAGVSVGKGVVA